MKYKENHPQDDRPQKVRQRILNKTSATEEYVVFDFPVNCERYHESHYCMNPISTVKMEFSEVRSDWLYGDESGDLYLSCDTCHIILNNVQRIEPDNAWGKADMIMV